MDGFEVSLAQLRASANAAQQAADVVRGLELGRVRELAGALPGTESAGTAGELGQDWNGFTDRWAEGMDAFATALTDSGKDYTVRDGNAERDLGRVGGR
jgi:hypothetical protein